MMEQEKENSHHFQTMLLPSPAGDDISALDAQNQFGFPQLLAHRLEKQRTLQPNSALPAPLLSAKYFC